MGKKLRFVLFLVAIGYISGSISAENQPASPESIISPVLCDAPAPDSFKITSVSSNFMSLSWHPNWTGAEHTLSGFEKSPAGVWNIFLPPFTVQGESYTVSNLVPGTEYRFVIATNCGPDDPSSKIAIIDGIALIIELTIAGRTPLNPVPVDCHNIHYLEHEWVGFKVETINDQGALISSLFEFQPFGDIGEKEILNKGIIMRVDYGNPIVATDDEGNWPSINQPSLQGKNPFRMGYKKNNGIGSLPIGRVGLIGYQTSVDLCADYQNIQDPWRKNYFFTAMIAEAVSGFQPQTFDERSESNSNATPYTWAKSPFEDELKVVLSFGDLKNCTAKVCLFNTTGQVINEKNINSSDKGILFNTGSLLPGFYFIRIESGGRVQTLKVVKM